MAGVSRGDDGLEVGVIVRWGVIFLCIANGLVEFTTFGITDVGVVKFCLRRCDKYFFSSKKGDIILFTELSRMPSSICSRLEG